MKELTDTMLSQDMGSFNLVGIVFIVIILLLALLIIIRIYWTKKKGDNTYKGYGYKIGFVIIIGFLIFIFVNVGNIYKNGVNSNWYLTYGVVSRKTEEFSAGDPGTTKTYYYVLIDGDKVSVTKDIYEKVQEGDRVYVLKDENNGSKQIYLLDEYNYVGDRLK